MDSLFLPRGWQIVAVFLALYLSNEYVINPISKVVSSLKYEVDSVREFQALKEKSDAKELEELRKELEKTKELVQKLVQHTKFQIITKTDLTWDNKSPKISTTNEGKIATKKGGGSVWNASILANKATNTFTVKVLDHKSSPLMIGFSFFDKFNNGGYNFPTYGWYLSVENGNLNAEGGTVNKSYYNRPINNGAVITASIEENCINFTIDGEALGNAFCGITGAMFPAVEFGEVGQSVEIV